MAPKTKPSSQPQASQKRPTSTRPRTVNLKEPDGFLSTPSQKMTRLDPLTAVSPLLALRPIS